MKNAPTPPTFPCKYHSLNGLIGRGTDITPPTPPTRISQCPANHELMEFYSPYLKCNDICLPDAGLQGTKCAKNLGRLTDVPNRLGL